jgi:hypothetical protein
MRDPSLRLRPEFIMSAAEGLRMTKLKLLSEFGIELFALFAVNERGFV